MMMDDIIDMMGLYIVIMRVIAKVANTNMACL
jgi:hypothetical protein